MNVLIVILKPEQTICEFAERGEIIGRQELALNDGQLDFSLIQPTGVDCGMNQNVAGHLRRR